MSKIYKENFPPIPHEFTIKGSFAPISTGLDGAGYPAVWYQSSDDPGDTDIRIKVCYTGDDYPDVPDDFTGWLFLGTFTYGALVLHVFWGF